MPQHTRDVLGQLFHRLRNHWDCIRYMQILGLVASCHLLSAAGLVTVTLKVLCFEETVCKFGDA